MAYRHGPWWAETWWGRRTPTVNLIIAVILLLFIVWKALAP
jgi:hypothetical protein